jgi:hypothetical protein
LHVRGGRGGRRSLSLALALAACSDDGAQAGADATSSGSGNTSAGADATLTSSTSSQPPPTGDADGSTPASDSGSQDSQGEPMFDVAARADVPSIVPQPTCHVVDDMDAVGACRMRAPAGSFTPEVQWAWAGEGDADQSIVIPLVANLTDDNDDGVIDLCDVPDVVVTVFAEYGVFEGRVALLDGASGSVHWVSDATVDATVTPALGDIDGDGVAEIVTVSHASHAVMALSADGVVLWEGANWPAEEALGGAIALADVDNDGDVEIIAGRLLLDHQGQVLQNFDAGAGDIYFGGNASLPADLDDDGDLEIVLGQAAYHHDGTPLYVAENVEPGMFVVADIDDDGLPEVVHTNIDGINTFEHDGTITFLGARPGGAGQGVSNWIRPGAVHDFDGDMVSEYAQGAGASLLVLEGDMSIVWAAAVVDETGAAGATAFDFLGDGSPEAMYADEHSLFVYDGAGAALLQVPRSSGTGYEYPIVVDVDNDGSAEILVVSNEGWMGAQTAPALQVIRDVDDRWIQARRIWNQHAYHVTNVREDGTIPPFEPPHWEQLNTFRTNAQIEGGRLCMPTPPG